MTPRPSPSPRSPASPRWSRSTATATCARYHVRVAAGRQRRPSRRAITRFGADHDLAVTENHVDRLGLEDVFLRLVNTKERAA